VPFNRPKHNSPGKHPPDDELDFVDAELLALASQLREQAHRLAATYPPKTMIQDDLVAGDRSPTLNGTRGSQPRAPGRWAATLAVLLLLAVVALAAIARRAEPQRAKGTTAGAAPPAEVRQRHDSARPPHDESPSQVGYVPVVSPAVLIGELSEPELEGWLDLTRDAGSPHEQVSL
jgi:hypothetical protein